MKRKRFSVEQIVAVLTEGDRREVSLSLKCPVIMSQASLVKQISENVPSVPEFQVKWVVKGGAVVADKIRGRFR